MHLTRACSRPPKLPLATLASLLAAAEAYVRHPNMVLSRSRRLLIVAMTVELLWLLSTRFDPFTEVASLSAPNGVMWARAFYAAMLLVQVSAAGCAYIAIYGGQPDLRASERFFACVILAWASAASLACALYVLVPILRYQ
jgi:hypothetical protein